MAESRGGKEDMRLKKSFHRVWEQGTLEQHERSLAGRTPGKASPRRRPAEQILRRRIDAVDEEFGDDEQYAEATDEAVEASTLVWRPLSAGEAGLVSRMKEWARKASARSDSKAAVLIDWLRVQLKPEGRWSDERVIVFSEYRDTQKWLQGRLAAAGLAEPDRLMVLFGGMDDDDREAIKAAFQADPGISPVRLLLATDAASEASTCSAIVTV